jgi:hypothetical protein
VLLVHPEVRAAVLDEHIVFLEAAFVEKERDPLAGGEFGLGVLRLDAFLSAAQPGLRPALHQLLDVVSLNTHSRIKLLTCKYNESAPFLQ